MCYDSSMYFIHELGRVMMMKILIVEDDKDIVAVISEELKQWGYETYSISNVASTEIVINTIQTRRYPNRMTL